MNAYAHIARRRRGLPVPSFLTRRFESRLKRDAELRVASEVAELSLLREELALKRAAVEKALAEAERLEAGARARIEAAELGLDRPGGRFTPSDVSSEVRSPE